MLGDKGTQAQAGDELVQGHRPESVLSVLSLSIYDLGQGAELL